MTAVFVYDETVHAELLPASLCRAFRLFADARLTARAICLESGWTMAGAHDRRTYVSRHFAFADFTAIRVPHEAMLAVDGACDWLARLAFANLAAVLVLLVAILAVFRARDRRTSA